jgi:glyceraldehyde 3-phosphate dehydrogenase
LHSSVVDLNETRMVGNLLRIVSWYDNEYAFSVRMLDVAKMLLM